MNKTTTLTVAIPLLTVAFSVSSLTSDHVRDLSTSHLTENSKLANSHRLLNPFTPQDGDYQVAVDFEDPRITWSDNKAIQSTESFTIKSDGSFIYSGSGSCKANGNFEADKTEHNRLGIKIIFEQSCFPMVGTHKGHVWQTQMPSKDEYQLVIYSSLDPSSKAIGWRLNKTQAF